MVTINDTPLRHAPGPWKADTRPMDGTYDIADAKGNLLAKVYTTSTKGGINTGAAVAQHITNYSPAPGKAVIALDDQEAEWVITALTAELANLRAAEYAATAAVLDGIILRVKQSQGRAPVA